MERELLELMQELNRDDLRNTLKEIGNLLEQGFSTQEVQQITLEKLKTTVHQPKSAPIIKKIA